MKKFLFKTSLLLLPFFATLLLYLIYVAPNLSGDLGVLGKIPFGKQYDQKMATHYLKELWVSNYKQNSNHQFKIITIGDSFSMQWQKGYQNYLAHLTGDSILQFQYRDCFSPEQAALLLLKSGFFQQEKTQFVIIESVEREFVKRLQKIDFNLQSDFQDILDDETIEEVPISKKRNYLEEYSSWVRLLLDYENPVKKAKLNQSFFSIHPQDLYFYIDDLNTAELTKNEIEAAKQNLLKLHQLFESYHINMIYMVASDKYDLYRPYIVRNSFPSKEIMQSFEAFDSTCYYLNTQNILRPLLQQGIHDVYFANDSHWSYIASEKVAEKLYEMMQNWGKDGSKQP
ncbi:MAG: hypothetical protein RR356_03610 [Bacteroidales bacterium]